MSDLLGWSSLTDRHHELRELVMTIVVTGATGHFGRIAIESLLRRGVPAADIIAVGRQVDKIADLGVTVRRADYEDPEWLRAAFEGGDRLLFVSGSEAGRRIGQHRNVVEAAKAAGISHVFYTSIPKADTSDMKLAEEHRATERMLRESGIPSSFLRNSWYIENYDVPTAIEHGLFGAAGEGRISGATRADFAEAAAAAVLTDNPQPVYELGGPAFTLAELAAEISRQSGRSVTYTDLPEQKYVEVLVGAGLPEAYAAILADSDRAASQGALEVAPDDLETLLGRPATPLATAIEAALG
jgi:NAD(P)H dehydrogenase (quinone)